MVVSADPDVDMGVEVVQPVQSDELAAVGGGKGASGVFALVQGNECGGIGSDLGAELVDLTCCVHGERLQDEDGDGN